MINTKAAVIVISAKSGNLYKERGLGGGGKLLLLTCPLPRPLAIFHSALANCFFFTDHLSLSRVPSVVCRVKT